MVFPARLAAIDVGSNAIRFLVADFKHTDKYQIVEQVRLPVRLGRSVFDTGELSSDVMHATCAALLTVADMMRDLRITAYRAVATSALRESANGAALVARVRDETGIRLEIISGDEEARLVYLAARERIDLGASTWLLVDIGGGSMELAAVTAERMLAVESHRAGALRFAAHASATTDDVMAVEQGIDAFMNELGDSPIFSFDFHAVLAIGGSIDALARLANKRQPAGTPLGITRTELRTIINAIAPLSYEERSSRFRLPADRADVILPAAILYERMAGCANAERLVAPQAGVKEGVLFDLAQNG